MYKSIFRAAALVTLLMTVMLTAQAQDPETNQPTSVDPKLIEWENSTTPREYLIGQLKISGALHLDTAIVLSISGLQTGQKFVYPGTDIFSRAITNMWRQKLFGDVQIFATAIKGNVLDFEIHVQELPRLASFEFVGIKKSDKEELAGKIGLTRGVIVTENMRRNIVEVTTKFYREKGFQNTRVSITERPDGNMANSNIISILVNKGGKVRIDEINFFENTTVNSLKLKKQMKGTREMSKFTLYPNRYKSTYGPTKNTSFREYFSDWGFLSLTKTRQVLDPYARFKLFSNAKFNPTKYEEDKEKIIQYYNSLGYRDAVIVQDTVVMDSANSKLYIDLKVDEGRKYYFGNITWKGNAKYTDSLLNMVLGIQKGDIYNIDILNRRLGKELSQDGGDITSFYQDDGYLFFRVDPVETAVYNDTIDHEIRITEGAQARINEVTVSGNERTKDHVILRELRTVPGDLFNRTYLIRSIRELGNLQYFNQETINPGVVPNVENGTVDINWTVEEKSSDQLELSAGWGGGIGLTGTLGVTFNNFSIKNIWKKSAWDPLPTGDGQKLSLRLQSNGRAFRSYNFSFTEPWLGGKKRNSFTVAYNNSKYSNAYDYMTGRWDNAKSDTNYLKVNGISVALGKQLKWPDDYFSLVYSLNFTQYKRMNYGIFQGVGPTGVSNNFSVKLALQRSSVFDPIFPRSGSNMVASVQFTPPYSLFNPDLVNSSDPYKNPEYHKWRFNSEWYVPIGKPMGAEKNRQFVLKLAAKYGFMGRYNRKLDYSPFERFQVGDAGLTNNFGLLGYDIVAHRGYPVYQNSDPSVNPDQQQASNFFTIFNKYQLELRYPLVTNPGSTIYGLAFFEAANGWFDFKHYNPFRLRRSAGVGMRFFLPMFGLLGFDYGIGFDRMMPGQGLKNASRFTFMLGFEPE